jgi:N-acetylglucosamine-6-sulfatase
MDRRTSLKLFGGAVAVTAMRAGAENKWPHSDRRPPNIVVVVVDDLRHDELGVAGHPYLQTPAIDRLAQEGLVFLRAMHATPLCSPNRACLLTGQYTATHGVYNNADRSELSHALPTFPIQLKEAGYTTAFIGKWHMGNDPSPRPGFDYWVSFPGQGKCVDPELFERDRLQKVSGYITDLLSDRAIGFLNEAVSAKPPFLLYLAHKAVHPDAIQRADGSIDLTYGMKYVPAPRHQGRYADQVFPRIQRPANRAGLGSAMMARFLERRRSPDITRRFGSILDPGTSEESIQSRAEMMLSIDESVGRIYDRLVNAGKIDDTVFIFTSDNGYFFGEHGLSIERRLPYEAAIRAPLIMRYPPVVNRGATTEQLVSSVDLAPTLLELAGLEPKGHVQGISFAKTLQSTPSNVGLSRTAVLIENFSDDQPMPWLFDADYKAIRTDRYKLVHWIRNPEFDELYDLWRDPQESNNCIDSRDLREVVAHLRAELARLVTSSIGL